MKRFLILLLMIFALCGCEGIIDGFINPDSKTDVTEVETEDNQTNDEQKTDIPTEDDPITDIPTGDDPVTDTPTEDNTPGVEFPWI